MKKNKVILFLVAEFAVLCVLQLPSVTDSESLLSGICMPLSLIGLLLGKTAASGTVGNAFAVMGYGLLCFLPLSFALKNCRNKEQRAENASLTVLSVVSAVVFPLLSNPSLLIAKLPQHTEEMMQVVQTGLCLTVYSVLVCFLILRLLRLFGNADTQKLYRYADRMLCGLAALFAASAASICTQTLFTQLSKAQSAADSFLAVILFAGGVFPYAADIAVVLAVSDVLHSRQAETDVFMQKVNAVSRLCCLSLSVMVAVHTAVNILYVVLLQNVSSFSVSLSIPFVSLAFVLCVLLFARLLLENRRLNDDNALFI